MRAQGIDISSRRSRHVSIFAGQRFGYVITLCDRVREVCPEFPGSGEPIHWSIPDPGAGSAKYPAFVSVASALRTRIGFLLARIGEVR
jgi:protein-tyrosine-phosphatase